MSSKLRKFLLTIAIILIVVLVIWLLTRGSDDFSEKYAGINLDADISGIGRSDTYSKYLESSLASAAGDSSPSSYDYHGEPIEIDLSSFTGDGHTVQDYSGCVLNATNEKTVWNVNVEIAGFYNIEINYLTFDKIEADGTVFTSRGVDMERILYINDTVPFSGAKTLRFNRLWTDEGEIRKDNQGNDIRPTQTEMFDWQTSYFVDDMGYETEPYKFWFEAGENTIALEGTNEAMLIGGLRLTSVQTLPSYEEYKAACSERSVTPPLWSTKIQGESAYLRSSPSLYARYDHSSSSTEPSSVTATVLNYIGGDAWNNAGDWIEWEFTVPRDGLYNITLKARQQYQRGAISCRSIYIDGAIPFAELSAVTFKYDTSWELYTLSDEDGKPFEFYLESGTHTIRVQATLGEMGSILKRMEDSIYRLNQIYRKVLVLTGVNPDRFRDYKLDAVYPEVIEAMDLESKRLYKLIDDTVAITGQKSDRVAVMQTLATQLEQFVERNERITQSFTNFKDNITSMGTAMQNMSETKLDIDYIIISSPDAQLESVNDGWLSKLWHEIKSCTASYFVDYNSLGNKYDEDDDNVLEVWIVTGRDQSTILKTMVDEYFPSHSVNNVKVNVKLVAADALLTAVVAGNGPDVVLSVDSWFAVNYAMRNAVEDLTQFEDFEEVTKDVFLDSALVPLTYNDGTKSGVYALPETQIFSVLFYRTDILEDLGYSEPPETWQELIEMLPTIQGNNMSVGVPYPDITTIDMSVLNSLIYQNGGAIYDADAKHTLIDEEPGVKAFKFYTSLYNDYGLPTVFDFVTRFRSGEMPIGVAGYTTYNTLSVSAPEIRGLWDFALFPGTLREDGTIDHSVHSNGTCCMMIATDDEKVKQNAWEFMKWWIRYDTQVRFGREMESILGASARYATANTKALEELPWSSAELAILKQQQSWAVGFREIAGGYSTTRHMTNAIRKVINDKDDPRETLLTYARTINEEIIIKRQEFGLPVD
ncbi:MAG: extracellular solute-binding protein [Clostridia bacterium]|nr:extracellular solute-binding protein [Clostridia bacterium]